MSTLIVKPILLLMKNLISIVVLFTGILLFSCFISSCTKDDTNSNKPKEQQVVGTWSINRVQLKLYYGGTFLKDTIVQQSYHPNYVKFDGNGNFEYKFNQPAADVGTYQFAGADSVISNVTSKIYRWKMLTLTDVLFTVMNTSTDPAFPGATVETYQTFVR